MRVIYLIFSLIITATLTHAQDLPVPTGLKAEVIKDEESGERAIHLTWDKAQSQYENLGYNLLVKFPNGKSLYLYQKAGVIYDTQYDYVFYDSYAAKYEFALMSIVNFPSVKRSAQSETIEVIVPSRILPNIQVKSVEAKDHELSLAWDYEDILDVEGFRIYANDKLVSTLKGNDKRTWSKNFEESGKYLLEIEAFTTSGVTKKISEKICKD
ncbi:hypothetical protein LVD15_24595 [Fulvivirga maritima]|uniref:hypothetical protein n=1 Tax=Fulvivirga maritima TaxID=2904247 RepID=UPI001F337EB0|nr:hypothetical protein [Fulvivirga maritima]UII26437.1 hypothetical protein LVD15_24595 [Fulvivirga maritima]